MFNKKVLAATMAVAITGGFVAESSAMEVATNDVGQVLLGSGYFAENRFNTEIEDSSWLENVKKNPDFVIFCNKLV